MHPRNATNVDQHVGMMIRQQRTLLGLSQTQLGERLGITFQQVQKYERGFNRVGASRLFELSRVLARPIGYFFFGLDPTARLEPRGEDLERDPMVKRETLELVRAYYGIQNPMTRHAFRSLISALAGQSEAEIEIDAGAGYAEAVMPPAQQQREPAPAPEKVMALQAAPAESISEPTSADWEALKKEQAAAEKQLSAAITRARRRAKKKTAPAAKPEPRPTPKAATANWRWSDVRDPRRGAERKKSPAG